MKLGIVTATLDQTRSQDCMLSWARQATEVPHLYIVDQDPVSYVPAGEPIWVDVQNHHIHVCAVSEILGVVPAFAIGVQHALEDGCGLICCFHDDLLIEEAGWDAQVCSLFKDPRIGLAGFGGGVGLADEDIYHAHYNPMQLARKDFVSNMRDAEVHGRRRTTPMRISCLDGFSQIGRRQFWMGLWQNPILHDRQAPPPNLFAIMQEWGIVHHAYDSALGAFAARLGWETWLLPIACHHFGGLTAVADPRYAKWANEQRPPGDPDRVISSGDQQFWVEAHKIVYEQFRDVLPLRR